MRSAIFNNACAIVGLCCLVNAARLVNPTLAWFAAGAAMLAVALGNVFRKEPAQAPTAAEQRLERMFARNY